MYKDVESWYDVKVVKTTRRRSKCRTEDPARLYRRGGSGYCYDCSIYGNIVNRSGGVSFTLEEFLVWRDTQGRQCTYCKITSEELYQLEICNVRNTRARQVYQAIGVDRRDSSIGYELDNMVCCCGPCNAIKSNILSYDEMLLVGSTLQTVWIARLTEV